jgi:probable phosphoglycerate mutase
MLPSRAFYLIRHGQSEANAARVAAGGSFDSPLNEVGREQARALAGVIAQLPVKPDVIYHSGMKRARETAEIINTALKLDIHERRDLREHEIGEWEGVTWDIVAPKFETHENPPGGETHAQFAQRIQSVITEILEREEGRLPMMVAHGGLFHALGALYEYGMTNVQNCHLHHFDPCAAYDPFPWRVCQFDIEGECLRQNPAPFCLSQALAKIA